MTQCPCQSGLELAQCCAPIIDLRQKADTAEALMRARYTAYTQANIPFIMNSTLPSSRSDSDENAMRTWAEQSEWMGLEIVSSQKGQADDSTGTVEFIARYKLNNVAQQHHERSTFVKQDGEWFFEDGQVVASGPTEKASPVVNTNKQGRNDPCSCGSGKKYKKCCGV